MGGGQIQPTLFIAFESFQMAEKKIIDHIRLQYVSDFFIIF